MGGGRKKPEDMPAQEFNLAAEQYYRSTLRRNHLAEAWDCFAEDIRTMLNGQCPIALERRALLRTMGEGQDWENYLDFSWERLQEDSLSWVQAGKLIQFMLLAEDIDAKKEKTMM